MPIVTSSAIRLHTLMRHVVIVPLCVHVLVALSLPVKAASGAPMGFTPGTGIKLELKYYRIDRDHLPPAGVQGRITIMNGHGNHGENAVMLYGKRDTPRLTGEPAWYMPPWPQAAIEYLTDTETVRLHTFPVGPDYEPPDQLSWEQTYTYTAVIRCDGSPVGVSSPASLVVINASGGVGAISIPIEQELDDFSSALP